MHSWNHYHCSINETIVKSMADAMVATNMSKASARGGGQRRRRAGHGGHSRCRSARQVGYTFVNIDDCWHASSRTADGRLTWNPKTFPSGMPALADYIHAKGLKFGIYSARCRETCQGFPASYDHEVIDAATFASWNVDYLKYDNCRDCPAGSSPVVQFTRMSMALNATARPIFYRHGMGTGHASAAS